MSLIIELVGQEVGRGQNPSGLRKYHVRGTEDKTLAYALVNASAPATFEGLVKQNVKVKEVGVGLWRGTVQYGVMEAGGDGDISWSFEIGTQPFHITHAREHIQSYVAAGTAPDHKGAIGVEKDGSGLRVQGTDILIPNFHWEETHYAAYATVATHAFITTLESMVGTMNDAAFRIWDSKELLLLGVSGAKRGEEPVGLTYRYAKSRTETNLAVGDITVAEKKGHDYLWVEYEKKEDDTANALTSRPIAAHVEQVYPTGDWSQLGLADPWN